MSDLKSVIPLFVILFICTLDGYSMMNYRLPAKRSYICFFAVTALCLAVNSLIVMYYGEAVLRNVIIFTIGLPYFFLILFITKDKISQTVFNFWLWINVYAVIDGISAFINDFVFRDYMFYTALRFVLLSVYYVLYNGLLKIKHRDIMEKLNVNWWIFSFIPLFFTVLICIVNYCFGENYDIVHKYLILITIYVLMLLVYILIFYTFKTVRDSMERERLAQNMKEQIEMQKKQYELYLHRAETERIFRHDARHRDTILMSCLESGNIGAAKELLNKELSGIRNAGLRFCENALINSVLTEYLGRAKKKGVEFFVQAEIGGELGCDEAEFCVMLSNLLENSLDAAKNYIQIKIKRFNSQLSLNIKNDYDGEVRKDQSGDYITTKYGGTGLGLKSVGAILRKNRGFLKIDDTDGVFDVFATLKG